MDDRTRYQLDRIGIIGLGDTLLTQDVLADIAMDAAMETAPNNNVPDFIAAYVDPDVIRILTAPTNAEKIFDPMKKGSRGVGVAAFPTLEETGEVAPYSDYGNEGVSDYNANFPTREEYGFQTMTRWGDLEGWVMSMAQINASSEKQRASANTIKRAHNRIWFFGVAGKKNYGILNDPDLPAPIVQATPFANMTADEVYEAVLALYTQLSVQMKGLLADGLNMSDPLKLCMSNNVAPALKKKNSHGISVQQMLTESFPGMVFVTAPEYDTTSGELVQLICPTVDGQKTGQLGYTELLHAHGVLRESSSYKEKKSAGTFGAVIKQPFAVAQMLGA